MGYSVNDASSDRTGAGSLARYLDGTYSAHNPDWHEADAPWKANQIRALLAKNRLDPNSVCDIGCGSGGILFQLRDELAPDARLVGYEIAPAALSLAAARPGVTIVNADPLADEDHFDLMLLIDVFEHVEDYLGFLRSLRFKADYVALHIPLEMNVQTVARMTPILHARRTVGHLHYFSRETALATLADAGYSVVDEAYTASGCDAPGRTLRQRAAAVPRKAAFTVNRNLAVRLFGGFSLLVLARPTPER